jgi:coniferyl-aldehyde dehydrogenase
MTFDGARGTAMKSTDDSIDLHTCFENQRAAFAREPYPAWSVRRDRLRRLQALVLDHEKELADAIDADFNGRPTAETELLEIYPALEEVKAALRHGSRWMRARRAAVAKWYVPARSQIVPQPLGVVGIIAPWNYPIFLSVGPLAGALAAGNRAMVKLSEFTPAFGERFARLAAAAFASDELAIVNGDATLAANFAALPFDHLLFTGSTAIGRKVMLAAAANLTPVTLELGGKSPAVIAPNYPLEQAVARILTGKLLNAGQTCIAPDYVLVGRAQLEGFVAAARARARAMFPQALGSDDYCSVVNTRQYKRLGDYLMQAREQGARIEWLFEGAQQDDARHRLAPSLVIDPPVRLDLMQDEIFGPILPVLPYDSVDEALRFIAARPRPLALYWFDHERARTEQMLRASHAGGVTVNDVLLHIVQDNLPFGGVGPSGMGHYHGKWGFETFSKLKPVFMQSRLNLLGLFGPPYRPTARRLTQLMKRL